MEKDYLDTVRLLLEVAPTIFRNPLFVLKGGTAINLFVRDMPRLSVDLDVVIADHTLSRDEALATVTAELGAIRAELTQRRDLRCELGAMSEGPEVKLFVERGRIRIKVEVNHVFRGTILPPQKRPLVTSAQDAFFTDIELPLLQPDELYGSKLVAAMDRQHPRDLFDVLRLFDEGGLPAAVVECFVCYLVGHNRPVHEVLFANAIDIAPAFDNEFAGMTRQPVSLDELLAVRQRLFAELPASLTSQQRAFLLGLVKGEPDWSLMQCLHLRDLPAIRWKLANLSRLKQANPAKFSRQAAELEARL
ncbi:MAG TPA: nucleotidyl transferase AbiEii/AbiGii toxin family protein [Bacteroidia bacterium]|nr:nucleotidyl transferase AbiEii/AbiGii toxin family protein [Bacteroidia bacterium]